MLIEAEFLSAGLATVCLHAHYLKGCLGNQKNSIVVKYKRSHFLRSLDTECFLAGFNDLYDLFKIDGLDVSLLCCFTL
jgi:hypothetical protein